jgi:HEAT repeat protein
MGFDAQNFGIGVLAGWATAYGVYRARHQLRGAITGVRGGATSAQKSATQSADSRYVNDVIEKAQTSHLGGQFIPLSSVLVEPRFIPPPRMAAPPDDEVIYDTWRVIPQVHDHPHLYAPYNIEALVMNDLDGGSTALALLGLPGSGRTTALMAIALYSLGAVDFKAPDDKIQIRLDNEEAALSEKDRAVRVKERVTIEQRAKEKLANERGVNFDATADEEQKAAIPLFRRLMPVYVHFADLLAPTNEYGNEVDPAEPVVRTVQYNVKRVTSSTIPRNLYKRLNQGQALVLIDGFDDLHDSERPRALAWLKAFMAQYGKNFIITVGSVNGSGGILQLGFTPIYLRPWNDVDMKKTTTLWADQWNTMGGKKSKKAKGKEQAAIDRALASNRSLLPAEVIFKTWANFGESIEMTGYEGWIRAALSRLLPADQHLGANTAKLGRIAALQLDEGYISAAKMQQLSISGIDADTTAAAETPATELSGESAAPTGKSDKKEKEEEDSETTSSQGRLLASLRKSGLIVRYRADRYQFRHPLLASYLASLWLKDAPQTEQNIRMTQAAWSQALAYMALHSPVDSIIRKRLSAPSDVLQSNLLDIARWLAYAPSDTAWRGDFLRLLGNLLIAPNQYPLARERVAAALLDTRDKNALLLFRRAVRNMNPDIRRLACLCMGALGEAEAIKDLKPLINDQNHEVQLAAGMALGAIGNEEALETMLISFTSGAEAMRQAMAEAFAALPDEGYPILYDAISHEDMMLRRAAVFGVKRIHTTWALICIYRAFLEDEQWYVRSAAQEAFQELQYGRETSLTAAYPTPDKIRWLAEWAASRGEALPPGDSAQQVLIRALQEGEPLERALAAHNLGQLGVINALKSLYGALRDRHDEVRSAAYRGLAEIESQTGEMLPNPV